MIVGMTTFTIRTAGPGDVDAVLEFWLSSAEGTNRRDSRSALEALLARDPQALILAENGAGHGGTIRHGTTTESAGHGGAENLEDTRTRRNSRVTPQLVGSVIAGWDGWRAHLYRLAVRPDRRREGIGRALLAAAEERFAEFGASRLDAMVLDGNDLARPAWLAAGYTPQPEWSRWVKYVAAG
jgi:ribosomal protein S18 acetylase RimI-like enzyme